MKNRKPLLASLLAAAMLITSAPLGILAPASAAETQNEYELAYESNNDGTCTVTGYTGKPDGVEIPEFSPDGDKVTAIGDKAFQNCSGLYEIIIPNSITTIGDEAFQNCASLVNIIIPNSVVSIGYGAFQNCRELGFICIPNGVTQIGNYAFDGCKDLIEIAFFSPLTKIDEPKIPTSTTIYGRIGSTSEEYASIHRNPFESIGTYTLIYHSNGDGTCTVTDYYGRPTEVIIPSTSPDGDIVTVIGDEVFQNNWFLQSVIIPESITTIEDRAFLGCAYLTDITIPDGVSSIGTQAFGSCRSLESIAIPEGVSAIKMMTFSDCRNLSNIIIPNSVTSIGYSAFSSCNMTNITIPSSVTSIDGYVFYGCNNLTDITIFSPLTNIDNSEIPISTTIHGYKGSTAEEYAFNNGNPFVPLDETNKFSSPEISKDQAEDGTPVNAIAVEEGELAAYANNRAHEDGSFDLRIILAENAVIQSGEKLTLSFYRDGSPEAYIISRTVADEYVAGKTAKTYGQVIAAGETYAASGSGTLFGFVVTGIPAGGFDSATLTVTAADGSVIAATQFTYATVAPQA